MEQPSPNRPYRWLLLALLVIVVIAVVAVSLVQRPAPPGAEIVGKALPEDHPVGACYDCHEGMSSGAQILSKHVPDAHPAEDCSQCHEGYRADPGQSEPLSPLTPSGGIQ